MRAAHEAAAAGQGGAERRRGDSQGAVGADPAHTTHRYRDIGERTTLSMVYKEQLIRNKN